jgi:type II secretory pathway pseudopilin PulG
MKNKTQDKGFSLIEVLISLTVIIFALVGVISLSAISISSIRLNKSKIIAANLTQEGLEIVKNIRDNNWLNYRRQAGNWLDGLTSGNYRVQYNQEALLAFSDLPLKTDSNGFYQYDVGIDTKFRRKITIQKINDDQIKVLIEVNWQEAGRSNLISAEARFYNWLKEI